MCGYDVSVASPVGKLMTKHMCTKRMDAKLITLIIVLATATRGMPYIKLPFLPKKAF